MKSAKSAKLRAPIGGCGKKVGESQKLQRSVLTKTHTNTHTHTHTPYPRSRFRKGPRQARQEVSSNFAPRSRLNNPREKLWWIFK
jgi:hypothetical protein